MNNSNYELIKSKINLLDYVQKLGFKLEKSGNSFKMICPFHKEKTPSFSIYDNSTKFKCFGCGANGDLFNFVEKIHNLTKNEAIQELLKLIGEEPHTARTSYKFSVNTPIKEKKDTRTTKETQKTNKLIYQDLYDYIDLTSTGKDYLTEKRCFSDEIIKEIGFKSIDKNFKVYNHLKKNWTIEQLRESGIIGKSKKGKDYLIFFNCVITPHYNIKGEIQYFLGKPYSGQIKEIKLTGVKQKFFYLNLNAPKQYVFESVFDAVAFYSLTGINSIISTAGVNQINVIDIKKNIKLITKESKKIILAIDNDTPGKETINNQPKYETINYINVQDFAIDKGIISHIKDWNELLIKLVKKNKLQLTIEDIKEIEKTLDSINLDFSDSIKKKIKYNFKNPENIINKSIINIDSEFKEFFDEFNKFSKKLYKL